jgi:hypothetical protein
VLEEYLEQHERMRAFNPTSVNTMRIWVFCRGEAPPVLLGGYLRIGRGGSLRGQSNERRHRRQDRLRHRETGARHERLRGPALVRCPSRPRRAHRGGDRALLERGHEPRHLPLVLFPNIRFAGFDIAVSARSPVVIELNVFPDLLGAALMELPLRPLLLP